MYSALAWSQNGRCSHWYVQSRSAYSKISLGRTLVGRSAFWHYWSQYHFKEQEGIYSAQVNCEMYLMETYFIYWQISRISALDPAFPPFYPSTGHISASDATMVDVIHTDAWLYGAPVSTGTVDFWPNSGKSLQPGCPVRNYKMLSDNGRTI